MSGASEGGGRHRGLRHRHCDGGRLTHATCPSSSHVRGPSGARGREELRSIARLLDKGGRVAVGDGSAGECVLDSMFTHPTV